MLSSKRELVISKDSYAKLMAEWIKANQQKSANKVTLQEKLVRFCSDGKSIKAGELKAVARQSKELSNVTLPKDKLSAQVNWYPEKDYLRVRADVTDAYFSNSPPENAPWEASSFGVFVCASGLAEDILQCMVIPGGEGKALQLRSWLNGKTAVDTSDITAYSKRTDKGYVVDVRIPWKKAPFYSSDYKTVLVEASVISKTPDGVAVSTMEGTVKPHEACIGYTLLKRK